MAWVLLMLVVTYSGGHLPVQGRYWLPFASAVWLIAISIAPRALPRRFSRATSTIVLAGILVFGAVASAFTYPSLRERFYSPQQAVPSARETFADVKTVIAGGDALDLRRALPAESIAVLLDGHENVPIRMVDRPDVLCQTEQTLLHTGFEGRLSLAKLRSGPHELSVLVRTPWAPQPIDTGVRATFDVPPLAAAER